MHRILAPAVLLLASACVPHLNSPQEEVSEWEAPVNSWPASQPPDGLQGEGFGEGKLAPDFRLVDQFGDEVSLYQFYGNLVVLDISTMWCSPCRDLAEGLAETQEQYEDEGFMYITVLPENTHGEDPSQEDLNAWVEAFEIPSPVVADPEKDYSGPAVPDGSYPVVLVLDRELVVYRDVSPPTDAAVRTALDELLAAE